MLRVFFFLALLFPSLSMAGAITKCVDAGGKVTFSQHGCPTGSDQDQVTVNAQRPSGEGPAVKLADPARQPAARPKRERVYTSPAVAEYEDATEPELVDEPSPPVVVRQQNQPCMRTVEQKYSYPVRRKDGTIAGRAGIRKVLVPC